MKKSSALALAIAGTLAAPMVLADGAYVSARVGIDMNQSDIDANESLKFRNLSSRAGWKGETDLGNGLTGFGKLEISTDGFAYRDLYVGLKGDWGKLTIAEKAYGAFYNHVTGPVDQPYWIGGNGFVYTGRTSNMIAYSGGSDSFSFEVGAMADGTDSTNDVSVDPDFPAYNPDGDKDGNTGISGYQAGLSIGLGDNWTVAAAILDDEDSARSSGGVYAQVEEALGLDSGDLFTGSNGSVMGVTVHGTLGDIFIAGSFQSDDDIDGIALHVGFSNFFVLYNTVDLDGAADTSQIGLGYAQSLGENTTFWAEAQTYDGDDLFPDTTEIVAALRYDIN